MIKPIARDFLNRDIVNLEMILKSVVRLDGRSVGRFVIISLPCSNRGTCFSCAVVVLNDAILGKSLTVPGCPGELKRYYATSALRFNTCSAS